VTTDETEIRSKTMLLESDDLAAEDEEILGSNLGCSASAPVEVRLPLNATVIFLPC
jgi:hypothetical protein